MLPLRAETWQWDAACRRRVEALCGLKGRVVSGPASGDDGVHSALNSSKEERAQEFLKAGLMTVVLSSSPLVAGFRVNYPYGLPASVRAARGGAAVWDGKGAYVDSAIRQDTVLRHARVS